MFLVYFKWLICIFFREKPKNEVMFHVLISEKFKQLKENNHHVYLCWRADDKKPVSGGFMKCITKRKSLSM